MQASNLQLSISQEAKFFCSPSLVKILTCYWLAGEGNYRTSTYLTYQILITPNGTPHYLPTYLGAPKSATELSRIYIL